MMAKKPVSKSTPEVPTDENKTFIAEVNDALREERLKNMWDAYKVYVIGAVVLLFVLVAGKEFYQSYTYNAGQAAADAYAEAQQAEDMAALKDIAESGSPFAPLAALDLADNARDAGDNAAAAGHYQMMIDNGNLPTEIRDLARYYAALVQLETDLDAAAAHLTALTGGDSPYRLSALELQARLFAARGEKATAATFYEEIATTPTAPATLRQRAQQALANLR